jgi:hypothetical protein
MPGTGHSARYKGSISNRVQISPFEQLAKWNAQLLGAEGAIPSITGGGGSLEFKKLEASDINMNTITGVSSISNSGGSLTITPGTSLTITTGTDLTLTGGNNVKISNNDGILVNALGTGILSLGNSSIDLAGLTSKITTITGIERTNIVASQGAGGVNIGQSGDKISFFGHTPPVTQPQMLAAADFEEVKTALASLGLIKLN